MIVESFYEICHTGVPDEYYVRKVVKHKTKLPFGFEVNRNEYLYYIEGVLVDELTVDVEKRMLYFRNFYYGKLSTYTKQQCQEIIDGFIKEENDKKTLAEYRKDMLKNIEPNERYP